MNSKLWEEKVVWYLNKCKKSIEEKDKRDLAYQTSIAGENAINILRIVEHGVSDTNFFMIVVAMKKFTAMGILSEDYVSFLEVAYDFHREAAYVSSKGNKNFTFEEIQTINTKINKMVNDIEVYLKGKGLLS